MVREESLAVVGDQNLWPALLAEIKVKRPLISSWIEAGSLIGIEGGQCLIGFPKDKTLSIDSLNRPANRQFIEEIISSLAGRPLTLKCETREGLAVVPPVITEKIIKPSSDPMDEFKNDPLIKKALEIFKAELQLG